MKRLTILLAALLPVHAAHAAPAPADRLIPAHGQYSQAYQSDWSALPTGKSLAAWDTSKLALEEVAGETARREISGQPEVHLKGLRLRVSWKSSETEKYKHTLFLIRDCGRVLIEDCVIHFADGDGRASYAFFIESSAEVTIRNVRVAGASGRGFLRLEGVENAFLDRIEIAGLDYGRGFRAGHGILVNGGEGWDEKRQRPHELYAAPNYRTHRWTVIQNVYVHDYAEALVPSGANHDGINIQSGGDGLIFNCQFENWHADSAVDISHRRADAAYGRNKALRLERCVFHDCKLAKNPGSGPGGGHQTLWANNVFVNTGWKEYHRDFPGWLIHNTWHIDRVEGNSQLPLYFAELRQRAATISHFRNNLISATVPLRTLFSMQSQSVPEGLPQLTFDYNRYYLPKPGHWLDSRSTKVPAIKTWAEWQAAGRDRHGAWSATNTPGFVDAAKRDFRLVPQADAAGRGTTETLTDGPQRLPVDRDFNGKKRPSPPSCGAFEP